MTHSPRVYFFFKNRLDTQLFNGTSITRVKVTKIDSASMEECTLVPRWRSEQCKNVVCKSTHNSPLY